ncbi:hypothetical protein GCM10010350_38200 [Streptomyces galilaeus]|nr:hypothetical protein GCM10010350_38200 [Streptomyces galilaeus]
MSRTAAHPGPAVPAGRLSGPIRTVPLGPNGPWGGARSAGERMGPEVHAGTDRTAEAPPDDRIPCLPGGRIPRPRLPQAQRVRSVARFGRASGRPSRPDAPSS